MGMKDRLTEFEFGSDVFERHDANLRCPICRELFVSPVFLTVCAHCFCSLCIRRHLRDGGANSKCPQCDVRADESHVKKAPVIDALVTSWIAARPLLTAASLTSSSSSAKRQAAPHSDRPSKKPKVVPSSSTSSKSKGKQAQHVDNVVSDSDSDSDSDIQVIEPEPVLNDRAATPAKVTCPICNKRVTNSKAEEHVSKCLSLQNSKESVNGWSKLGLGGSTDKPKMERPSRMNRLNATTTTLQEVRSKLQEIGFYDASKDRSRTKDQLIARHSEFVLLYNSNQDANVENQKSDKALVRLVREKERMEEAAAVTRQRQADTLFHPKAHLEAYREQFRELEAQIRDRMRDPTAVPVSTL